jgi:hypothetical protein
VRFYRTVSPVPDALRRRAVCSLLHFPSSHLDWPLASTLPCGARTFLDGRPKAPAATTCPARARSASIVPPNRGRDDRERFSAVIRFRSVRPALAISCLSFLVAAACGCRRQATNTAPAPSPSTAGAPTPGQVTEAEARGLVDAWLAAQNRADFAAYQQLYATRFDGIKRAGPRTRRFTRADWLKDRARMFAAPAQGSPMAVAIEGTAIQAGASTARVDFIQTFARGSFKDRGPKQLLLARENGALRIAREEMLSSQTEQPTPPAALAAAERGFFFVIEEGVVLSRSPGRTAARGPLTLLPESNVVYLVRSAVDDQKLDDATRSWRGQKLQLYDDKGPACVATVKELSLLVRVDPHFSTTQLWDGIVDESGSPVKNGKPYSKAAITREAWAMGEPILVGTLAGGCKASWARDPALPQPAIATVTDEVEDGLRTEAEKQVRRDPAVAAAEKEARTGTDREEGAPEPTITVFKVTGKGTPLLIARFEAGGGCADWVGMTFIWELGGGPTRPRLRLLNKPVDVGAFTPAAGFDLDGDGRFELLGAIGGIGLDETVLLRPAGGYGDRDTLQVTSLDCYC